MTRPIRRLAPQVRPLAEADHLVLDAIAALTPGHGSRLVVAIAGPPAAGKSTLADRLRTELSPGAAVLGLDAFHFDNAILEDRGDRPRKGAPHTFDVVAYRHTLELLRNRADATASIPVFDRTLELTRNCAELVTPDHSIIITEGNYLLLDTQPWNSLADLFDLTVWVDAEIEVVEQRILDRWATHGLDAEAARARAEDNDLPNARLVLSQSRPADINS